MGQRADTLRRQVTQHSRIHEEANAALMDAEDALMALEDRERRRTARRASAAQFPGRVEV